MSGAFRKFLENMFEIAHIRLPKPFPMLHCNASIVGIALKIYAHHESVTVGINKT